MQRLSGLQVFGVSKEAKKPEYSYQQIPKD
jgi:hypothetical protein